MKQNKRKIRGKRNIPLWITILSIIITFLIGGIIGPYMQAWFSEIFRPKPAVHFIEDACCIVPLGGTNYVFCKTVIRNDGQEPATPLSLHIEVNSPYILEDGNKTYTDFALGGIRPGHTLMHTFKVTNPTETVEHGSLTVDVRIENTHVWDKHTFSLSW